MPKKIILAGFLSLGLMMSGLFYFTEFHFTDKAQNKPKLGLMTSIPLILGEVSIEQMVSGQSDPAPAYKVLKNYYDIIPLDVIDDRVSQFNIILLAQAKPLTGPELVSLDGWVRQGGHIVILSDAALQWHSEYSLGDKRRPLFTSLLSPLFKYWGLEQLLLLDEPKQQIITINDHQINTVTPAEWSQVETDAPDVSCQLNDNRFEAICAIGKGKAVLIADSDFINDEYWLDFAPFGEDSNMQYLLSRMK